MPRRLSELMLGKTIKYDPEGKCRVCGDLNYAWGPILRFPCEHTFCRPCITGYLLKAENDLIHCAVCKHEHWIPSFPYDFSLNTEDLARASAHFEHDDESIIVYLDECVKALEELYNMAVDQTRDHAALGTCGDPTSNPNSVNTYLNDIADFFINPPESVPGLQRMLIRPSLLKEQLMHRVVHWIAASNEDIPIDSVLDDCEKMLAMMRISDNDDVVGKVLSHEPSRKIFEIWELIVNAIVDVAIDRHVRQFEF